MSDRPIYHEESRKLQDQFDTRRLADRLVERLLHSTFNDEDRSFIEDQRMFFLATTDADGFPDCSYKAAILDSCVSSTSGLWFFRATTETECSRASATSAPIPRSGSFF